MLQGFTHCLSYNPHRRLKDRLHHLRIRGQGVQLRPRYHLLVDVMDVEKTGVLNCFVNAGSKLQRTWFASEADAFVFVEIARHKGATPAVGAFSDTAPIT